MITNFRNIIFLLGVLLGNIFFYQGYESLIDLSNFNLNLNKTSDIYKKNNKSKEELLNNKQIINPKVLQNEIIDIDFIKKEIIVKKGQTFSSILKEFKFSDKQVYEIINVVEKYLDLRLLKVNQKIIFNQNNNLEVKEIVINTDIDKILKIILDNKIKIEEIELEKNYYQESKEFKIVDSLYADGLKNDLPQDILIKLIRLFSFDLDFQRDIKIDTRVEVSYDFNQIDENNIIDYLDINYAIISIAGKELEYCKCITSDGYVDYFNREGKNVKKSLLKTPLDGARLSSHFGMRKHPISCYNKMHKGVDFAAPKGTPIYAGGNGIIEYIGNNGGYGKYIRIRHNNEYKTAYAHLSNYKKGISRGVRVNQGDVIGFVGSTGNSTGPHLHYEIIYQDKHINPLKLKLPSGKVLQGEELERFKIEYKKIYANHLNLLYE